jgi:large subunit ribosomal protein L10
MSNNLELKKQIVSELVKGVTSPDTNDITTVIINYSGITVNNLNSLRTQLFEQNSDLKVAKNTLIERTLNSKGIELDVKLEGQNAILLTKGVDIMTSLNVIFDFLKKSDKGSVTLGILNNRLLTKEQVEALSKLPSKEQLIAQVVGTLASPIRNFEYVLNGVQSQFVRLLQAVSDKKTGGDS